MVGCWLVVFILVVCVVGSLVWMITGVVCCMLSVMLACWLDLAVLICGLNVLAVCVCELVDVRFRLWG